MTFDEFKQRAGAQGLSCLLIGGHAVIAHGHQRTTFDWDLLIPRTEIGAWRDFVLGCGFSVHEEGPTFVQFDPPDDATFPLDLMMVEPGTYEQFRVASLPAGLANPDTRMVSLPHLIALKCHAVRHGHPGRVEQDVDDVLALLRINRIDVRDPEWRQIISKHGPSRMYEKVLRSQEEGRR